MSKQVVELEVIPSPLNGRVGRLDSAAGVLREMARIYRAARTGRIPMADASRLTFMLSSMGRLYETVELEQRVTALETRRQS
ncbi:MAG: hypothetical protein BroJett012_18900 [Betaproteobacteria bacterium]|nr:MAG: hypothetical protein BroJett012_18900 [Betaproteobacteria bacterium]